MMNLKFWNQKDQVIKWDVLEYYGYLPSAFIYHDLSLKFTEDTNVNWSTRIWALQAPNGQQVFKMSMGMAMMYAPFFGLAHIYAQHSPYAPDGYSAPYKIALMVSALFYLFWGLWFLRKLLLFFYSDKVTAITILLLVAGTNLWYYSCIEAPLSHVYSFSLLALFLWLIIKFYENPQLWKWILSGFLIGIISLIRPTNIIILLVFLFWNISNREDLKNRILFYFKNIPGIILLTLCMVTIWIPQLLYWHMQTGQWFYYSYANNQHFFFNHPQIINGLFSYRKGWFIYTPLMFVVILAIPLLKKTLNAAFLPLLIFVPVNIYIITSWWCWWYGGCFGQRSFIDSYGLMALPLAALLTWLSQQAFWKTITGWMIILSFSLLSIFFTAKYYYGSIHWDSMTRKAYWNNFMKIRPDATFYHQIKEPDYEKAARGEPEYEDLDTAR